MSIELLVKETCNAALTAQRRGTIGKEAADRSVEAAIRLSASNVRMFPQTELIRSAVKMASTNRLTIYDALYLALAKTLGAPLLSLDTRLAEAAEKVGVRVLRG